MNKPPMMAATVINIPILPMGISSFRVSFHIFQVPFVLVILRLPMLSAVQSVLLRSVRSVGAYTRDCRCAFVRLLS